MYFCTNPPLYLLVASVTTLFDVRRMSFARAGQVFHQMSTKPTGIKRSSNRYRKQKIIGKLAEMSAERGGFKRVYIIIPLPSQIAVSQLV